MGDRVLHVQDGATSGASYAASGGFAAFGGLTANDVATYVGIILAVGTFAVNWYYKHKSLEVQKEAARIGE